MEDILTFAVVIQPTIGGTASPYQLIEFHISWSQPWIWLGSIDKYFCSNLLRFIARTAFCSCQLRWCLNANRGQLVVNWHYVPDSAQFIRFYWVQRHLQAEIVATIRTNDEVVLQICRRHRKMLSLVQETLSNMMDSQTLVIAVPSIWHQVLTLVWCCLSNRINSISDCYETQKKINDLNSK